MPFAPAVARISDARAMPFHHAPRILADRVVDFRRRNAVTVLHDRVQGDAVVRFGQVLASDADQQAAV
jgi:hypothetical protein